MKLLQYSLALFLTVGLSFSASAQERYSGERECGVKELHPRHMDYREGRTPRAEKSLMTQYVPARFIILGDNDGNGYVDPLKLLNSYRIVNEDFENMNVQFYIHSIDYVDRTSWYDHESFSVGQAMMNRNNQRGVVNNYIVENPAGNCGYYSPGPDALVMGKNCLGGIDRTWSHELGHYFTLPHTFFGWESVDNISDIDFNNPAPATLRYRGRDVPTELVDGSNCEDAADGFCDTSPDFLMNRWACNRDGFYADSLMDADSMRFAVSGTNIMSYALDNCVDGFTPEQEQAMVSDLNNPRINRTVRADNSGEGAVAANGEDQQLIFPENNATLPVSDQVELRWNSVENADYYILQVNTSQNLRGEVFLSTITTDTTFEILNDLRPNTRYYWRVRPFNKYLPESDFGDQVWRFRNGEFPTSTIDAALNAAISVVPNPISAGRELLVAGRELGEGGNLSYELIDAAGRVLTSRNNVNVASAGFTERIATDNLRAGVYFLRLRLNGKLVTKRVMVTP